MRDLRRRLPATLRRSCAIVLLLAVVIGLTPVTGAVAVSATYYVSPSGADTNPGTLAAPFKTVQAAAEAANSGDTVLVRAGTYNDRVLLDSWNVASGITLRAYPGERPNVAQGFHIGQAGVAIDGFEVTPVSATTGITDWHGYTSDYSAVGIRANNVTVRNCYIHNLSDNSGSYGTKKYIGVGVTGAYTGIVIENNNIAYTGDNGITVDGSTASARILRNTIDHAGYDSKAAANPDHEAGYAASMGDGIAVNGNGCVIQGNTITYSWLVPIRTNGTNHIVRGNDLQALYAVPAWSDRGHKEAIYEAGATGCVYDSNIFRDSDGAFIALDHLSANGTAVLNTTIVNNLFIGRQTYIGSIGLWLDAPNQGNIYAYNNTFLVRPVYLSGSTYTYLQDGHVHFKNNIFAGGDTFGENTAAAHAKYDHDYNVYASSAEYPEYGTPAAHELTGDPRFVSRATGDVRLQAGSRAIGAGAAAYAPAADYAGATFAVPPSAGAYEYVSVGDTTPPTVSLTAPLSGAVVSGPVALAATAADNVTVSKVEFRVDGVLVGSDTTAPYTAGWDAAGAAPGTHAITATAYDAAGNTAAASASVVVPTPPDTTPADTTAPAPVSGLTAAPTSSVALSWINPTDPDFAAVRILRSTLRFASSSSPATNQVVIYEGTGTTYVDEPPTSEIMYYTVFARDTAGNWSVAAAVQQSPVSSISAPRSIAAAAGAATIQVRLLDATGRGIGGKTLIVRRSDGRTTTMTEVTVAGTAPGTYRALVYPLSRRTSTKFNVSFGGDGFLRSATATVYVTQSRTTR